MPPAIAVSRLGKSYRVSHDAGAWGRRDTFTDLFADLVRRPFGTRPASPPDETFWALRDVSFEVQPGEVVGIIGRNGAGKSTLLKILSRITAPTEGRVELRGRIASLLEVGTGFHPELTGRENVYMNGSILGMKRAEIDRKFDAIVDFAGVERFLDTPLKRYSSGMYVRLAFAVAAHLDPEILIVDEVLAVGDAEFQKKCLGTMKDAANHGRTVLFVSHNMVALSQLCSRALRIDGGRCKRDASTAEVIHEYLADDKPNSACWERPDDVASGTPLSLRRAWVSGPDEKPVSVVDFDRPVRIVVEFDVNEPRLDAAIVVRLGTASWQTILTSWDVDGSFNELHSRSVGRYLASCEIPAGLLAPDAYLVSIGIRSPRDTIVEFYDRVLALEVSAVGYRLNRGRAGTITPTLLWHHTRVA